MLHFEKMVNEVKSSNYLDRDFIGGRAIVSEIMRSTKNELLIIR
jgi:hypothetical protein